VSIHHLGHKVNENREAGWVADREGAGVSPPFAWAFAWPVPGFRALPLVALEELKAGEVKGPSVTMALRYGFNRLVRIPTEEMTSCLLCFPYPAACV
jgi:hypothetical protein